MIEIGDRNLACWRKEVRKRGPWGLLGRENVLIPETFNEQILANVIIRSTNIGPALWVSPEDASKIKHIKVVTTKSGIEYHGAKDHLDILERVA